MYTNILGMEKFVRDKLIKDQWAKEKRKREEDEGVGDDEICPKNPSPN